MKKIFTLLMFVVMASAAAFAQDNLNISALFDGRYHDDARVAETMIKGSSLSEYQLSLYHSLTVTDAPELAAEIESLVVKDARDAVDREVAYRDGGLYYGFYELSRGKYLFFLNRYIVGGNKLVVIYLEGVASKSKIKQMLK